ncbi:MAG: Holliday junction resolvase RuvX [Candidatus Gastranaerophilales bacterium]|nr:Holliday junction resolvase RuvX [Candidatus Gastranaerophilales bacterium]
MEIRKRIIALDIGTKRIGIATCDALWINASPLKTINRNNDKIALEEIEKICQEYQTNIILIGVPYNMDGTLGFQAKNCLNFIKPLRNNYVILEQDERLSSSAAEEILRNQGKKYTKNKALVDAMAASVILKEYIENNR